METHRFDTADLPEEERFAAWAGSVANFAVEPLGPEPFAASAQFWRCDRLLISLQRLTPVSFVRDPLRIRLDQADHRSLILMIEGECRFDGGAEVDICQPGDLILTDLALPSEARCTAQRSVAVLVPRPFLDEAAGPVEFHGRLPATPATRLLADHLTSLTLRLPDLSEAAGPLSARVLRDLIAACLIELPGRAGAGLLAERARAKAYIEAAPMGSLGIAAMAKALGLSRSTLYRLFTREGGVLAYDRRRRLLRLHACLVDPAERRGIAELAYHHGFHDAGQLSLLFRKSFGYTASALRARTADLRRPASAGPASGTYRDAVAELD